VLYSLKRFIISDLYGIESCAPFLVTAIEAADIANFTESIRSFPCAIWLAKTPLKQSPAPTVSIAFTLYAGRRVDFAFFASYINTPSEPRVVIIVFTPYCEMSFDACIILS